MKKKTTKKATKFDWDALREIVKNTDKQLLGNVCRSIDGHTIYDPKKFTEVGLDKNLVVAFTKVLCSGTGKEQIYDSSGEAIEGLVGVYGLELLEFIARTFGVESWKMGRGSRAAHLNELLVECNFTPKEVVA